MALIVKCKRPQELLEQFESKINHFDIVSWSMDEDKDFTVTNGNWSFKAWMRPTVEDGRLVFGYVSSTNHQVTKGLYGIFHGRLAATLLAHFDDMIESIEIQPQLDSQYDMF